MAVAVSAINPKMIDLAQPITPACGPRSPSSSQVARTYGCQFGCLDRRYSNEHSRRQHYRRHHKAEMQALRDSSKGIVKDRKRRSNSLTTASVSPSSPTTEAFSMGDYGSIYSRGLNRRTSLEEYYETYDDFAEQGYSMQYANNGSPLFTPDSAQSTYIGNGNLFDFTTGTTQKQQLYHNGLTSGMQLLYSGAQDNAVFWEDVTETALDTSSTLYIDGFTDHLSISGSYSSPYTLGGRSSSFSSDFGSEPELSTMDHYSGMIPTWWDIDAVPGIRGVDPVLGYGREDAMWEGVVDYNTRAGTGAGQRRRPIRSMSLGARRDLYDETMNMHAIHGELAQLVRGHPRRHTVLA